MADRSRPIVVDAPIDVDSYGPGHHRLSRAVARTADGADIRLPVNVLRGPRDGPRLVAIAGIHGDEHDGPAALLDLIDDIDHNNLSGTLVMVPVANPPAFRSSTRWNVADGQNLNRIFPGEPDGAKLYVLVRHNKDWLLAAGHNTFVMEIAIEVQKRELEAV